MNEMMERYIYDVTRRLPEKERGEVGRELEAGINDMLPDNPGEQDVIAALTTLGEPRILAERYRQKARYLISPAMFDPYISVLKVVAPVVAGVFIVLALLTGERTMGSVPYAHFQRVVQIFAQATEAALAGAMQAAFWVTLVFAIAGRRGYKAKPWTVADLPRPRDQKGVKIPRSSTVTGLILTVFFTGLIVIMLLRDEWFLVFANNSEIIPLFSPAARLRLIPFIIIQGSLSFAVSALKLYWARWNLPLCIVNAAYTAFWLGVTVHILHWPDLFSAEMIAFTDTLAGRLNTVPHITAEGIKTGFAVLLAAAAAIEIGTSAWKTWKGMRTPA
ncbi:MAG: hypothetical protein LBH95_06595 [Oscillospiraceae bacterium]|jgi:hypothetical protein|nr:hypothetical protein [Oscillospiraceae bacterium]